MKLMDKWDDYELIDINNGYKSERFGDYILKRPEPQVIWNKIDNEYPLDKVDSKYCQINKKGYWKTYNNISNKWQVKYKGLVFNLKLMNFKHTGIFPEQSFNWDYMMNKIKESKREISVLNLFAYTGGASLACLKAGATVHHVDSSKAMIDIAKENVNDSNLNIDKVKFIIDDCKKFVEREIRRNNKYDAIIMDPPTFGRGINKEIWNIEKDLNDFVEKTSKLLSDNPLFFLINSYTPGITPQTIENIININIKNKGITHSDELGIKQINSNLILPCGVYGLWESNE